MAYGNFAETFVYGVDERQERVMAEIRSLPAQGTTVTHCGKEFVAFPNVWPPYPDSTLLLENLVLAPGASVLDVGTGTGVIAVFTAYRGAGNVVAVDINPDAVRNAQHNVYTHGFASIVDVRLSDVYSSIKNQEQFDVITANLPFRNKTAKDIVAAAVCDTDFNTHRKFFAGARRHLKTDGRIYLCQASFGDLEMLRLLSEENGFSAKQLAEMPMEKDPTQVYYVFEFRPQ